MNKFTVVSTEISVILISQFVYPATRKKLQSDWLTIKTFRIETTISEICVFWLRGNWKFPY